MFQYLTIALDEHQKTLFKSLNLSRNAFLGNRFVVARLLELQGNIFNSCLISTEFTQVEKGEALHSAVVAGAVETAEVLISAGAQVNFRTSCQYGGFTTKF